VALGKAVTASDAADLPESSGWLPAALVDGFTSKHRIIEIPEYLDLIERRGLLEREAELLIRKKERKLRMAGQILGYGGVSHTAVLAIGSGWMLMRQRSVRNRAMIQLREQIARDLHDDIGSTLGGIVLLSEIGSGHSADPQSRADFQMIKAAADEASASMRDIVWLVQKGHMGLRDQVTKMRQSAQFILGDKDVYLTVEPSDFRDRGLSLLFRRHVLFSFKEALNNIRKHADATKVEILILIDTTHLTFTVRDDGTGFDPQSAQLPGHGLANLRRRAERLRGTCRIESGPGGGSTITFTAPLKS
jgi:signal transduction histidine kinase